jgi:23S rRNA (adenine1618-N6)-methyltransferase
MSKNKKVITNEKPRLHPRNQHRERYDFKKLIEALPELSEFVLPNKYGDDSVDFANPEAVKMLNKALLKSHYDISEWDIPEGYLCPPIPGRADYIHYIADLLRSSNYGNVLDGEKVKCLDIGVGANCVYPIIGVKEYGWTFIGSEIDSIALDSAQSIIDQNPSLHNKVELRLQTEPKDTIYGALRKEERVDLIICNPPFHSSPEDAKDSSLRKLSNLKGKKVKEVTLNFGGKNAELWCEGGERKFIMGMIRESKKFAESCFWFSSLVSKQTNLKVIYESLEKAEVIKVETIPMGQGNKSSRIVAWTFLTPEQQKEWRNTHWKTASEKEEHQP